MNQLKEVQPIRDQQQLEDMKWALKSIVWNEITYFLC
jgi:hypothetical protein